ncbi:MAG: FkbM family methyltransferase [Zavarzinella sp.]
MKQFVKKNLQKIGRVMFEQPSFPTFTHKHPVVYIGEGLCITILQSGDIIAFPSRDMLISPPIIFTQQYEAHITRVLSELLRPHQTFIDIGANIGIHAVRAARLVGPQGKVIGFEPMPNNFLIFHRNIMANGLQDMCTPVKMALSNKNDEMTMEYLDDFCGNGMLGNYNEEFAKSLQREIKREVVPVTTLDQQLSEKNITKVDLIKIDVEGVEVKVLEGMLQTIKQNPHLQIISELWAAFDDQIALMKNFADAHQFKMKLITETGEMKPTTFDQLPRQLCDIILYK